MPIKKVTNREIASKTTAPVKNVAKPPANATVSAHKTRTASAIPCEITTQQIADLAYFIWLDRGCPNGSPEEDWLQAESKLLVKAAGA